MRFATDLIRCALFSAFLIGTPASEVFIGAPPPPEPSAPSPLTPDQEQASFSLPPGFEIELVASESEGIGKFVTVAWDLKGRMWSMTALEYPVDANESPEVAKALYASIAKDKVLVWDKPFGPGPHKPRVFADGLAIPLGILPYQDGVYVQHGPDIAFLSDTDNDGKADTRETILTGFGVQDSHLFPHQFTRAPGNWIWFAQGAFNYGKVKTSTGAEHQFDRTRMARFRYDGSDFVITSQGPCNIWGLVLNSEGEAFIQEANDYGYPLMPFHEYANYPGCSDPLFKSYAPEFPPTAPHFQVGGTGLSGLALSDSKGAWPQPYAGIFYLANPITRKIQTVRVERDGPRYKYEQLPDFVLSSDEMFRPVAIQFGPDGCLYIVDWYNKIISHNEVPRAHPERDKTRGRIWRVKHKEQTPFAVPDFAELAPRDLLRKLGGDSIAQSHLAWQAIGDRQLHELVPDLNKLLSNSSASKKISALWALEGLRKLDVTTVQPLLSDGNRNVRREAFRALGEINPPIDSLVGLLEPLARDPDPEVRAQLIRTIAPRAHQSTSAMRLAVHMARPSLEGPTAKSTANGRTIKIGEAYEREFERYLVRLFLEQKPDAVSRFLESDASHDLPLENRMVAALAMDPRASAAPVARLVRQLDRPPNDEELLRLAEFPAEPGVLRTLEEILFRVKSQPAVLEALLKVRSRFDAAALQPFLHKAAAQLLPRGGDDRALALRLVSGFKLATLEPVLVEALENSDSSDEKIALLKALREIGAGEAALLARFLGGDSELEVRNEAVAALAASRNERAPALLLTHWPELNHLQRRSVLDQLSGTKMGANAIVRAIRQNTLAVGDVPEVTMEKLTIVFPDDQELARLREELLKAGAPVLRLDGSNQAWLDSKIVLDGPFTVETWIRLEGGINNEDGILGAPGVLDINFAGGHFRAWVAGHHDVIIAKKKVHPEVWTHVALTRERNGAFRIYLNGELDSADSKPVSQKFENLRLGWTTPNSGTLGMMTEYRVWNVARSAEEIRRDFDRSFRRKPRGLAHYFTGTNWPASHPSADVRKSADLPPIQDDEEAQAIDQKFRKFRALFNQAGDVEKGRALFSGACQSCHAVGGEGGQVGPVLNGTGAMDPEGLLRAVLTPNAAMEAGYRTFRVELSDGEVLDGFLVSQDENVIVLRRPNSEDQRIPQDQVRRAEYLRTSLMPEGLLEGFDPGDATDLLAYLKTLK